MCLLYISTIRFNCKFPPFVAPYSDVYINGYITCGFICGLFLYAFVITSHHFRFGFEMCDNETLETLLFPQFSDAFEQLIFFQNSHKVNLGAAGNYVIRKDQLVKSLLALFFSQYLRSINCSTTKMNTRSQAARPPSQPALSTETFE